MIAGWVIPAAEDGKVAMLQYAWHAEQGTQLYVLRCIVHAHRMGHTNCCMLRMGGLHRCSILLLAALPPKALARIHWCLLAGLHMTPAAGDTRPEFPSSEAVAALVYAQVSPPILKAAGPCMYL